MLKVNIQRNQPQPGLLTPASALDPVLCWGGEHGQRAALGGAQEVKALGTVEKGEGSRGGDAAAVCIALWRPAAR